jgi:hypothetical protein
MKVIVDNADYTVQDELNFIAWIASNGISDHNGRIKSDEEINGDGIPRKARSCFQRIEFLRKYAEGWNKRSLPDGWDESDKVSVVDYIFIIAIPTVASLREVQLGDLV